MKSSSVYRDRYHQKHVFLEIISLRSTLIPLLHFKDVNIQSLIFLDIPDITDFSEKNKITEHIRQNYYTGSRKQRRDYA